MRNARDSHILYDQAGCLSAMWSRKNRRGASNTASPSNADVRLYCGESWLSSPVPKGEPFAGSLGYSSRTLSRTSLGALG